MWVWDIVSLSLSFILTSKCCDIPFLIKNRQDLQDTDLVCSGMKEDANVKAIGAHVNDGDRSIAAFLAQKLQIVETERTPK